MSKFFEALEQVERDRALRGQVQGRPAESPHAPEPEPTRDTPVSEAESAGVDEHLVSLLKPTSWEAEQYRALRHVVEQAHRTYGLQVVGVSSPGARDGKTITAINLAGALAQAPGTRVLLIDMDLRHPTLASHLGLEASGRGFAEAILDPNLTLDDVARPCLLSNLAALPARRSLNATYELLNSLRCKELVDTARARYDYVVIDLPPLVPAPDCQIAQKWIDGFLVVVAAHKTPRKLFETALAAVTPTKVVGLIFNSDDRVLAGYGYARNGHEAGEGRRGAPSNHHRWLRRLGATRTRPSGND